MERPALAALHLACWCSTELFADLLREFVINLKLVLELLHLAHLMSI
jgi:hypothetical protein